MKKVILLIVLLLSSSNVYATACVEPATCTWVVDVTYPANDVYNWSLCNATPPTTPPPCDGVPASYLSVSYFGWEDQLGYCQGQTLGMVAECTVPEPEEPPHCQNDVKDGDESGIDCGGSCLAPCVGYCPESSDIYTDSAGEEMCAYTTPPDSYGNCPDGWIPTVLNGSPTCISSPTGTPEDPYFPAPTYAAESDEPANTDDTSTAPPTMYNDSTNPDVSVSSDSNTSTTANPDSTFTDVTTTTTTNADSSVTTTTETTERDADDNVTSYTSTSNTTGGTTPVEDDPENYDYGFDGGADNDYDSDFTTPDESSIADLIASYISAFPLFSVLDTFTISTDETICAVDAGIVYDQFISFDFCSWEVFLNTLGSVFVLVAQGYAIMIVIGRK